jgi:hypothetical protein
MGKTYFRKSKFDSYLDHSWLEIIICMLIIPVLIGAAFLGSLWCAGAFDIIASSRNPPTISDPYLTPAYEVITVTEFHFFTVTTSSPPHISTVYETTTTTVASQATISASISHKSSQEYTGSTGLSLEEYLRARRADQNPGLAWQDVFKILVILVSFVVIVFGVIVLLAWLFGAP